MTRRATLTQAEIARMLRAALQVGGRVEVVVERGRLRLVVNETQEPVAPKKDIVL